MAQKITLGLLALVLAMIALMQMSVDLYTPSFPAIQQDFQTTLSRVQLTLSLFLLGFSCSHPIFGPWSDKIGRKTPLLIGIGLNIVGSIICIFSPSILFLILGRFMQGFGIGSCNSVGRSLARDLLSASELAKLGAQIGMVSVLFLALSPTLGGYLQNYFGWRSNFIFLSIVGIALITACFFFLPETNQSKNPGATSLKVMKANYQILLKSPIFMGYTLCACFASAGIVTYLTIAPFLLQKIFGLTPIEFGKLAFIVAGGVFLSGVLNYFFVAQKGIRFMLALGSVIMFMSGVILLICIFLNVVSVVSFMFSVASFSIGGGLTFMNAFPGAFGPFPHIAGTTAALYGFMQDMTAAMVSYSIAMIGLTSPLMFTATLILLSSLAVLSFYLLIQSD